MSKFKIFWYPISNFAIPLSRKHTENQCLPNIYILVVWKTRFTQLNNILFLSNTVIQELLQPGIHNEIKGALCNCASITENCLKCLKFATYISRPSFPRSHCAALNILLPSFIAIMQGAIKTKKIDPLPRKIQCNKSRTEWIVHFSHFSPCQGVSYLS